MEPNESMIDLLNLHDSTRGLDDHQIRRMASDATVVEFCAGEEIHTAGTELKSVLLIMSGEMEVSASMPDGSSHPIMHIGRDDHLGFVAIHDTEPLPYSVVATQDTLVIRIAKCDAVILLQDLPAWRRNLVRSIGPRFRQVVMHERLRKRPRLIALLHADAGSRDLTLSIASRLSALQEEVAIISDDPQIRREASGLTAALSGTSGVFRTKDDLRSTLVRWTHLDRVILDASMQCKTSDLSTLLAPADAIYCVCGTDSIEQTMTTLKSVFAKTPRIKDKLYLIRVLEMDEQVAPRFAALEGFCKRDFKVHRSEIGPSLVCTRRTGLERIIHHLRGVSIGLALGGGAARGMAHLGVLNVLENEGIVIDRMSGTSAGALTGIGYAAGLSADSLIAAFGSDLKPQWLYRMLPYGDALYMLAKYRRGGWERMLRKYYQDWRLEQLPIPFTAVAADLVSASEIRRSSGDATEALLESINLPVLSRPICRDGMTLVDGGILNVVPANVLVEQDASVVVAVDVSAKIRFEFCGNRPDTPTHQMKIPSTAQTALRMRTVQDRNIRSLGTTAADLVIEPDVSKVEVSDFQHAAKIAEIGRIAAEQAMPSLRKILHQVDPQLFPGPTESAVRIAS